MPRIYSDKDADLKNLQNKVCAVLGFGSQGHAHALNLKDSGVNVIVGLYPTSKSRAVAKEKGFEVFDTAEAVRKADVIFVALPDTKQADVYKRDIEPNLALHYTSGGPDGVMGPGWSISGVSAIARCGKTWASNGSPVGVTLATSDDLCLDGDRMRLISGAQGMGGSIYQTELTNFSLVIANGAASSPLTYFTVEGKDGRFYEYGNTGN